MPLLLLWLRDYAFNLLFARGRHDLAGVGDMVTQSFARCLQNHFQTLEAKGHWNKIERVCSVQCEKGEAWQEGDTSYVKLLVSWKALDYIVNYNRRAGDIGYIVDGDPNKMESFEEEWIVTRRAGDAWLVDAMYPAPKKNALAR
jgi:predicted lipid-binding transport protein (Tim44 family)